MALQNKQKNFRIASFLPAATEMACALGLIKDLVGVSHECDFPPEVKQKPVVVRCAMDLSSLNLKEIDKAVSSRIGQGQSVYALDEKALQEAAPDLILTQDLCQVCAPSGNEASQVLQAMTPKPEILFQTPHSFEDILKDLLALGDRTGTRARAEELVENARKRIDQVVSITMKLPLVKVFFMEWVDPVYCGGHWVPEMLQWAGGKDDFGRPGADSVRVDWQEVTRYDPDVLFISPCGFNAEAARDQASALRSRPGWEGLSAVKNGRVFALDGNSYFARPALRLVEGVELLTHLIHPESIAWKGPANGFLKVL